MLALHDDPGIVHIDPSWTQAAWLFIGQGFFHILDGIDHLLFLLCLVIPFRRFRALVPIVTAFTVAHSITLIASAYDMASGSLVPAICRDADRAVDRLHGAREHRRAAGVRRRWIVAFGFGLIHGFGFSFALREELQLAGAHVLTSLLAFNVGVELGQLLVLAIVVPVLTLVFRYVVPEWIGAIILSALVAQRAGSGCSSADTGCSATSSTAGLGRGILPDVLRGPSSSVALSGIGWLISGLVGRGQAAEDLKSRSDADLKVRTTAARNPK